MKKLLIALVLVGACLSGCTMVESMDSRHRRMAFQADLQMRDAVGDWDYFWLAERNSRLHRWADRIGY